jgi:hypothetical protein
MAIDQKPPTIYAFRRVWRMLAALGFADGIDGAEYERVLAWWRLNGRPWRMLSFIWWAANKIEASWEDWPDVEATAAAEMERAISKIGR